MNEKGNSLVKHLREYKTVLLKGYSATDFILEKYIYPTFRDRVFFSSVDQNNVDSIRSIIQSPRWNGKKPLIIFHGHESWSNELVPILRSRQSKQGILFLVDDAYGGKVYEISKNVDVTMSLGKTNDTIYTLMKHSRLSDAVTMYGIETVLNHVHRTNKHDFESLPSSISDIDLLAYDVPTDITSSYLTSGYGNGPPITIDNTKKTTSRDNHAFLDKIIIPLVAKNVGHFMSGIDALEYVNYAHMIQPSPMIMKCPRDDQNEKLVRNVNDKIRSFIRFKCKKRKL